MVARIPVTGTRTGWRIFLALWTMNKPQISLGPQLEYGMPRINLRSCAWIVAATLGVNLLPQLALAQDHDHKGENLGTVSFDNSCSAAVQPQLQRGVAMLHSFRYIETEKAFNDVLTRDSTCAVATWGLASILMTNPLTGIGPPADKAARGQAALARGQAIGAKTQRERDYIAAVAAYYEDWATRPENTRQANRAEAYSTLATRYPDDDEAQIFAALYIAGTQSLSDTSFAAYRRSNAMLTKQLAKHPDHPGVAHYLIHVNDAPVLAGDGLASARSYASIAPDAPHALHMPSHIFTRVGAWKESAGTNERSAAAAARDGEGDEQLHAMDYMVYAYLQLGRDDDASRTARESQTLVGKMSPRFVGPYALAAMPARVVLERGAWREAMVLAPQPHPFGFTTAQTHFARALGAARSGNHAAAVADIARLAAIRDSLITAKADYWAGEVEVARRTAVAWATFAKGDRAGALSEMRAAADQEDKSEKHIVTPGRLLPARELLGDMLLEAGQPAAALKEYEASQLREPHRLRGYAGAAAAAEKAGDSAKARRYYALLVEQAGSSKSRPEVARAQAYLSKQGKR